MKCLSCGKENKSDAKYCKYCGAQISTKHKTCPNGHNYDASLDQCPYCPHPEVTATITKAITSAKTVIDKGNDVKTNVNGAQETSEAQTNTVLDKKTIIVGAEDKLVGENPSLNPNRLAGWLVSFELDPEGKDFKIFEGRTKIGRSAANNIIINKPEISDEHVLILSRNNKFIIQDQLSANGTFVNGKKVEGRMEVKDNDEIKLGTISFKLKLI
ncbi:MAG: FHA domain-containing protein [Ignavibacteria bacterium]|nr:FHA domain-containing protein [Ignavibacteria bacterium]